MKYIDAEKLSKAIEDKGLDCSFVLKMERLDTLALIDSLEQEQPQVADASKMEQEVELEKASRNVYESWKGGTMDDFLRDMAELGKALNARKGE